MSYNTSGTVFHRPASQQMPVGDSVVSWLAVDEYASTASGLEVSESLIFYLGLHLLWGPGQCSQYSDLLWAGQFGA